MSAGRWVLAGVLALCMVGGAQAQRGEAADRSNYSSSLAPAGAVVAVASEKSASVTADSGPHESSSDDSDALPNAPQAKIKGYQRPTEKVKIVNYFFDAYGPYPLIGSALVAGINQANNTPPEWDQGLKGFGRRWGSNYGIGAATVTTRYALAELLREDTLYYRCECKGFLPRLGHAMISTFTGRRGDDGHRVFSIPSLVSPYAGTMIGVYGWYPGRYGAKDAFREGNYALLAYAGSNVFLEFFPNKPGSLFAKMHLQNRHGAPEPSN
jgi:hypothetical protein